MTGRARRRIALWIGTGALLWACSPPTEPDVPEEPDVTKPPPRAVNPKAPAEGTEAPAAHGAHP